MKYRVRGLIEPMIAIGFVVMMSVCLTLGMVEAGNGEWGSLRAVSEFEVDLSYCDSHPDEGPNRLHPECYCELDGDSYADFPAGQGC